MPDATVLRGGPLADDVLDGVRRDLEALRDEGVTPRLGTVLMSDRDADVAFMDVKHERCAALDVPTERIDVPPDAPESALLAAVDRLREDDAVTALFVQVPLPGHVDEAAVRDRIPPAKDVDCFAHENLGRLVADDPRVVPPTTAAVTALLDTAAVETDGAHAVVVGRTTAIGRPIANRLLAREPPGNATVTVCHSRTADLGAVTREADVLVTAAGAPRLVTADMVADGVTVVDVSVNRVPADTDRGYELVGDVDYEPVAERAAAITPVPGGVGPLTLAYLLRNVVDLAADRAGVTPPSRRTA